MDKSSQNLDLTTEQSTHLLKLCLRGDQHRSDETKEKNRASMLLDVLGSKLPVNPALLESLPPVLQTLSAELKSVSGRPLGDFLQDAQTKTPVLRKIKDFAKELGASLDDPIERDVGLAVYFAAIASALVFHQVRISQYSFQELAQSFETLLEHNWITPDLHQLFSKTREYCNSKA